MPILASVLAIVGQFVVDLVRAENGVRARRNSAQLVVAFTGVDQDHYASRPESPDARPRRRCGARVEIGGVADDHQTDLGGRTPGWRLCLSDS